MIGVLGVGDPPNDQFSFKVCACHVIGALLGKVTNPNGDTISMLTMFKISYRTIQAIKQYQAMKWLTKFRKHELIN